MLRVRAVWTGLPGLPGYTNLYFGGSGEAAAQDAVLAVQTFLAAVDTGMINTIDWATEAEVVEIDPTTGLAIEEHTIASVSGGGSAAGPDPLPFATQAVVSWKSAVFLNGRRLRGRTFLPGWPEAANVAGIMEPSTAVGIQTAAQALADNSLVQFGIYSRTYGVFGGATSASVSQEWGVLRSRRD